VSTLEPKPFLSPPALTLSYAVHPAVMRSRHAVWQALGGAVGDAEQRGEDARTRVGHLLARSAL
jgi:hypothetical protein